jgi:hypothetical protein
MRAQAYATAATQSSTPEPTWLPWLVPLRSFGHGLQHTAPAFILHIATAQLNRINGQLDRELVDGLLGNECES